MSMFFTLCNFLDELSRDAHQACKGQTVWRILQLERIMVLEVKIIIRSVSVWKSSFFQ